MDSRLSCAPTEDEAAATDERSQWINASCLRACQPVNEHTSVGW